MSFMNIKIETGNGIYTIRKPTGHIGAIHFGIISSSGGGLTEEDLEHLTAEQVQRFSDLFVVWTQKVLKNIVVDGPFKYDDMPGEDQYVIYLALTQSVKMADDLFRVVED